MRSAPKTNRLGRERRRKRFPRALALVLCLAFGLGLYGEWLGRQASIAYPPRGEFHQLANGRLHYRDIRPVGASLGTIVLVHGAWSGHADLFSALAPALKDHRVIAIDRPGEGWSERLGDSQMASPARQAGAIMQLLDAIAPEKFVLVAHSLGAPLSAHIALERPARVKGLVLLGAVTHPWLSSLKHGTAPVTSAWLGPIFNRVVGIPLTNLLMAAGASFAFAPNAVPPNYADAAELPLLLRAETFRDNAQDIVAADAFVVEQAPRYKDLKVPVVAIAGDHDPVISPATHSAAMVRAAPLGSLILLPGVGHMPHHAAADIIARAIRKLAAKP